jgi:hypothetical protein
MPYLWVNIRVCTEAGSDDVFWHNYQRFGTFTVTVEDAKEYLYSFSTRRRVYKFQDIKVNLYI